MKIRTMLIIVGLLGSFIWLITKPDWEPFVTCIGLIATLIGEQLYSGSINNGSKIVMKQKGGKGSTNYQSTGDITIINEIDKNDKKINQAFLNLKSVDFSERRIASEYIINNFPETLSDIQLKEIIEANPINASNLSETQTKLCVFLKNQKKAKIIEDFFKHVILYDPSNAIAWRYLLRKDVNIDLAYIFSIIKGIAHYQNILQYAMETGNDHVCMELLNSHNLVNFLISNAEEKVYLKQSHIWISKMIDSNSSYKNYRNTYFFKAVTI